jgi:hypothetical protein
LCCACFMEAPQPVSARTAQGQTASQNLSKLVGVCGQLKCCLRYEQDGEASCGCRAKNGVDAVMQIEDRASLMGAEA